MGISVNGVDIDDRLIEQELPHHRDAANPLKQSVHEVVLRASAFPAPTTTRASKPS